jgi:hypothetical protein
MDLSKVGTKVVVIGRGVWGMAPTLTEALKNARKPKEYIAYLAPMNATISEMGSIQWNKDSFTPVVIDRKFKKVKG